ncbi:MAG: hypothetical protein ACOC0D_03565 [Spirochaeta sp.]
MGLMQKVLQDPNLQKRGSLMSKANQVKGEHPSIRELLQNQDNSLQNPESIVEELSARLQSISSGRLVGYHILHLLSSRLQLDQMVLLLGDSTFSRYSAAAHCGLDATTPRKMRFPEDTFLQFFGELPGGIGMHTPARFPSLTGYCSTSLWDDTERILALPIRHTLKNGSSLYLGIILVFRSRLASHQDDKLSGLILSLLSSLIAEKIYTLHYRCMEGSQPPIVLTDSTEMQTDTMSDSFRLDLSEVISEISSSLPLSDPNVLSNELATSAAASLEKLGNVFYDYSSHTLSVGILSPSLSPECVCRALIHVWQRLYPEIPKNRLSLLCHQTA